MINQLSFINWKSFKDATLWIDPLTFIIGTNAAGKSNIVDALAFLAYASSGGKLSEADIRGGVENLITRQRDFSSLVIRLGSDREEYTYEISVTVSNKELLLSRERLTVKSGNGPERVLFYTKEPDNDGGSIKVEFLKDKRDAFKELILRREVSVLSQIPNLNVIKEIKERTEAVIDSLKSISVIDPKPEKMRDYTRVSDRLAADGSNIAGLIAGLPENQKQAFENTLTEYVRPLPDKDLHRIWAEPIGLFKTDAMLYCAEEWIDGQITEFDARSMSDGTLRFIAVIAALLTARKGDTVVIEEVDNGLHPSRAGELVMALKTLGTDKGIDIICTTHNPVLIDSLGPDMVPFISYVSRSERDGSSEIHLLEEAPDLLKLLANYTPGGIMTKGLL